MAHPSTMTSDRKVGHRTLTLVPAQVWMIDEKPTLTLLLVPYAPGALGIPTQGPQSPT